MSKPIPFTDEHEKTIFSCLNILKAHAVKLDEHSAKLDEHSAKLDEHSAKLDAHSAKLDEHSAKLDAHSVKLDALDTKVEEGFREMRVMYEQQDSKLDRVMEFILQIASRGKKQDNLEATLENHEHRLSAVEVFLKQAD